jgi:hypothetical protein
LTKLVLLQCQLPGCPLNASNKTMTRDGNNVFLLDEAGFLLGAPYMVPSSIVLRICTTQASDGSFCQRRSFSVLGRSCMWRNNSTALGGSDRSRYLFTSRTGASTKPLLSAGQPIITTKISTRSLVHPYLDNSVACAGRPPAAATATSISLVHLDRRHRARPCGHGEAACHGL